MKTPWLLFGGSVVLVAGLAALMLWKPNDRQAEPLVVWCAAALSEPMKQIVPDYEKQTGVRVELRFGKSEEILTSLKVLGRGDVFLPADESYIRKAQAEELLAEVFPLVRMEAVLVVNKKANRSLTSWDSLFENADAKLAIASPGAAVREVARARLGPVRWKQVEERSVSLGSVTDVANAVSLGGAVTAGIIWDSPHYAGLEIVKLKELEGATATVQIGVVKRSSRVADAIAFARYVANNCADIFEKQGFKSISNASSTQDAGVMVNRVPARVEVSPGPMGELPEIILYAGAMLRPAIEVTIKEFEKREGVIVTTIYNGCGILVSQMNVLKGNERFPDAYFSCDPRFMDQVADLFEKPKFISKNQLVIAVKKGNPRGIKTLHDLGHDGLRVGVGHEQQCALGAITAGVLIRSKALKAVEGNIVVRSPSGDLLVNQLRAGSLDAVVAYVSNVKPYENDIEAIKVEEVNCQPAQPIAVSRSTAHPDVVRRLISAIESADSRARFEKLGFGWELKP